MAHDCELLINYKGDILEISARGSKELGALQTGIPEADELEVGLHVCG
jgi:hypothetical protein